MQQNAKIQKQMLDIRSNVEQNTKNLSEQVKKLNENVAVLNKHITAGRNFENKAKSIISSELGKQEAVIRDKTSKRCNNNKTSFGQRVAIVIR